MILNYNKKIMLNVVDKKPKMGKTAVMKVIYMLQQVKGIKMGYNFSIYTYGPYSSDVKEDVDDLISKGLINVSFYQCNNYVGYELSISNKGKSFIKSLSKNEEEAATDILKFVKGKTAKDLELYSTIIYVDFLFTKNSWNYDHTSIMQKVHDIKQWFTEDKISEAVNDLIKRNYLTQ